MESDYLSSLESKLVDAVTELLILISDRVRQVKRDQSYSQIEGLVEEILFTLDHTCLDTRVSVSCRIISALQTIIPSRFNACRVFLRRDLHCRVFHV